MPRSPLRSHPDHAHEARPTSDERGGGPLISVIIPVYNERKHLPHSLPSVFSAAALHGSVEIIFVDNGSTDGSREFIERHMQHHATLLEAPDVNVGEVRNVGAAAARGVFLSFIDADCTIPNTYFDEATNTLSQKHADATGSPCELPDDASTLERTWDELHAPSTPAWVSYINTGNFFCRAEPFRAVGGFDATLESGEDAELGLRLIRHGYRIYRNPEVRATHLGNPRSLWAFYRRQIWHGLGAFGTFRWKRIDKPLLMTLAYTGLLCVSAFVLLGQISPSRFLLTTLVANVIPLLAMLFRMWQVKRFVNPFAGLLLYHLYFLGRATGLVILAGRRLTRTFSASTVT